MPKIHHADVKLHEDATDEDLIDVIEGSRVYIPAVYAINKIDQITVEELDIPHDVLRDLHQQAA